MVSIIQVTGQRIVILLIKDQNKLRFKDCKTETEAGYITSEASDVGRGGGLTIRESRLFYLLSTDLVSF